MWKIGPGGKLLLVLFGLAILAYAVDRHFGRNWLLERVGLAQQAPALLTAGDFPPGAAAPAGDLVAVPLRPIRILATARGSTAALLHAAGGKGVNKDSPATRGYGVQLDIDLVAQEKDIVEALATDGDHGGADAAVLTVDRYVQLRPKLADARLKAVMLLSRSRGEDAIAAGSGIEQVPSLAGRKVAVATESPARYLLLWSLTQNRVPLGSLELVQATSSADAARLLRESRVDAAIGSAFELEGPARERAGRIIASTADAPHLVATVLVVRSEVLARWPDAVRRLVRAVLDSSEAIAREPTDGARLLAVHAKQLGDPFAALKYDPPAGLADNLAFFGVRGDSPVRYEEAYSSAASLWQKLGEAADTTQPSDTRELGPLLAANAATPSAPAAPRPAAQPARPVEPARADAGANPDAANAAATAQ